MRSGELFAGVGGLGMAVDEVFGSTPAWFAEFDAAPSKVLAHHFPDVPNYGDVTKIHNPPKVNILAGGFPCQDVSLAGRRRGMKNGTRSGLWSEYARIIDETRPDWVVIENVRGLLSADAAVDMEPCPLCVGDNPEHVLRALGAVLGDLAELGFDAEWIGIRAADIGAPHGRFRVFILAWPRERTIANSGSRRGWGRTATPRSRQGAGADVEAHGSDTRNDRASAGASVTLLPTPVAQPSGNTPEDHLRKKPGREIVTDLAIIAENGLIGSGGRLLPTPGAYDGERGGSQHPDKRRAGNHSVTIQDVAEHLTLMPTPRASRGGSATETMYNLGAVRVDDERSQGQVVLLPTPTASEGAKGVPNQAYGSGGATLSGTIPHLTEWGPYTNAIARWESVTGRPAPSPVRMDGKGGKARLNPELTEWMMGWPASWVTSRDIGLSRAEQLKACGNGVVPQQAAAALRELLTRPGVPRIESK